MTWQRESLQMTASCANGGWTCVSRLSRVSFILLVYLSSLGYSTEPVLQVAIGKVDVTPNPTEGNPVWLAGYGWGRRATGVHDPLFARCVILDDGAKRLALISVDVVGLQYPEVLRIRERLSEFSYVLVSSTHNHEGPDTIGLWGKTPFQRGVDPAYLDRLVEQVVQCVRSTSAMLAPAVAEFGMAEDESLLGDSRKPYVKDGRLRVLRFRPASSVTAVADASVNSTQNVLGILVQWNCHPEALGSRNTLISADFPATTVAELERRHQVPVAYFSGAVGGLMGPPDGRFHDAERRELREGEFAYAEACGRAVADLADQAMREARPIEIVPFRVSHAPLALPVQNVAYRAARVAGVLRRKAVAWDGDFHHVDGRLQLGDDARFAVVTEVASLRLGTLWVHALPGELYPELVYGSFQDPVEPHVDYPDAPREPTLQGLTGEQPWLFLGLANDEVGYIIPKSQWDQQPPFAYGRTQSQYGEINSCGPDVAPILMEALAEHIRALQQP